MSKEENKSKITIVKINRKSRTDLTPEKKEEKKTENEFKEENNENNKVKIPHKKISGLYIAGGITLGLGIIGGASLITLASNSILLDSIGVVGTSVLAAGSAISCSVASGLLHSAKSLQKKYSQVRTELAPRESIFREEKGEQSLVALPENSTTKNQTSVVFHYNSPDSSSPAPTPTPTPTPTPKSNVRLLMTEHNLSNTPSQ